MALSLDNDQLDAHLLYFTIRLLYSSRFFKYYELIIRRLNCIDAASGILLSVSGSPVLCTERSVMIWKEAFVSFKSPNLRAETDKTTEYHGHYIPNNNHYEICGMYRFSFNGSTVQVGQGLFYEVPRSHTDKPQSSGSVIAPSQRPLPDNTQ
jgi:hypothetical protein